MPNWTDKLIGSLGKLTRVIVVTLSVVSAFSAPGFADQTIRTARTDPAFEAALSDWLNDDEAAALPALAELAASGNEAARLLLGLIDKTPALQGPLLHLASRDQRLELLRAPGGLSGRSWLQQIDGSPLARAWTELWSVDADLSVVGTFSDLNEPRAAREALVVLAARENPALGSLDPAQADPSLLYLLWRVAPDENRQAIAAHVPARDPQRLYMGERLDARAIDQWLAMADAALPIRALCEVVCPEDAETCRSTAYRSLNSHNALLTLGTPAETLVSQEEFLHSARGRASVMRRILLSTPIRGRRAMLQRATEHSACLGRALSGENSRYMRTSPAANETENL